MLEIACFNVSAAIVAAKAGADRIELCADYAKGGITPSYASLERIRQEITIPINVMIRPRAGNFVYTDVELFQMRSDIERFKTVADGFVFGVLDDKNHVDYDRNRDLVQLATPLPCTFHRAFDQATDLPEATARIIDCGFTSVLTSGGQATAIAGADSVTHLQRKFGDKISFILGGGVRSSNIDSLRHQTNVSWYHSAAIMQPGETADQKEVERLQNILKQG